MGFIKKLVDVSTQKNVSGTTKFGHFRAEGREGTNVFVIDYYHKDNHVATLSIDEPSVLGVRLEHFQDFNQMKELQDAARRHYSNVEIINSIK